MACTFRNLNKARLRLTVSADDAMFIGEDNPSEGTDNPSEVKNHRKFGGTRSLDEVTNKEFSFSRSARMRIGMRVRVKVRVKVRVQVWS